MLVKPNTPRIMEGRNVASPKEISAADSGSSLSLQLGFYNGNV
jgi:hypothetical protein